MEWLEREPNKFNPLHWHLAQIAAEVYWFRYMMAGKEPPLKRVSDFVLKWKKVEGGPEAPKGAPSQDRGAEVLYPHDMPKEKTEEEKEAIRLASDWSKAAWMGILGYNFVKGKPLGAGRDKAGPRLPDKVKEAVANARSRKARRPPGG